MRKNSLFIAVEGIDRSGKSELVKALDVLLTEKGIVTKRVSYPNRKNLTGSLINSVLQNNAQLGKEAMHLLFSANRWEDMKEIEAFLCAPDADKHPKVLLCDRYVMSGVSYSMMNGLSKEFSSAPDQGIIQPDLTLFLDVTPDITSTRNGFGEEIYEKIEPQWQVYHGMKSLLPLYKHCVIPNSNMQTMHKEAFEAVLCALGSKKPSSSTGPAQEKKNRVF
ncbi:dTMP kinase [Nematocida sp. AWRm77]|nr:dTMP kinase [Nematocida sp. AWRm77]